MTVRPLLSSWLLFPLVCIWYTLLACLFHCLRLCGEKGIKISRFKTQSSTKFVCRAITQIATESYTRSTFGHQKAVAEERCRKTGKYYRSPLPTRTSNSYCFQSGFPVMVSPCTVLIPQAFRGRQDVFNGCPALSQAARSVTRSGCPRQAPCLAPCSEFRPFLLQKHVEAGCNPWKREKECKGAGCFMELRGAADSSPTGGSLTVLSTGPAVSHAWHQGQLCPCHSPSEPEHSNNCRGVSVSLSYLNYSCRHVPFKCYKVL